MIIWYKKHRVLFWVFIWIEFIIYTVINYVVPNII